MQLSVHVAIFSKWQIRQMKSVFAVFSSQYWNWWLEMFMRPCNIIQQPYPIFPVFQVLVVI